MTTSGMLLCVMRSTLSDLAISFPFAVLKLVSVLISLPHNFFFHTLFVLLALIPFLLAFFYFSLTSTTVFFFSAFLLSPYFDLPVMRMFDKEYLVISAFNCCGMIHSSNVTWSVNNLRYVAIFCNMNHPTNLIWSVSNLCHLFFVA